MTQAGEHLPAESARPAMIFFTDGRHEAEGVPVENVVPARDLQFGARSPFGLLPVGLGVDPDDLATLEAGLVDLRITRDLERCEGGALEWPDVVFESAEAAGQAVALALQDVSCTFTVEPTPTPTQVAPVTPSPEASASASASPAAPVGGIRLVPGDAVLDVTWTAPVDVDTNPVEDYQVRCRPNAGGDWIEGTEGVSPETTATFAGLANGVEYACEVAAVRGGVAEGWTQASATAAPFGRPPPPTKPTVQAVDSGARVSVTMPADAPVVGFAYECSADGGTSWPVRKEVIGNVAVADVPGLTNGTDYVCRVLATNDSGVSDASPVSDVFRPCAGLIDCNPAAVPLVGGVLLLLVAAIVYALWRWYAGRRVYVVAQVDNYASVSLGRGPRVAMAFVRRGPYRRLVGVAPAQGPDADVRIRYTGGESFEIEAAGSTVKATAGRLAQIRDGLGETHSVVLRALDEAPAELRPDDERA